MCFMEGQGVDGHVGDDFWVFFMFIFYQRWSEMVLTQSDSRAVL